MTRSPFHQITTGRLYARNGVEEYWILHLHDGVIEVHRDPTDDTWTSRTIHGAGAVLQPAALPGIKVAVAALLAFAAGQLRPEGHRRAGRSRSSCGHLVEALAQGSDGNDVVIPPRQRARLIHRGTAHAEVSEVGHVSGGMPLGSWEAIIAPHTDLL